MTNSTATPAAVNSDSFADDLAAVVYGDASEWPEWTDAYRWVPNDVEPTGPTAADEAAEAAHWSDTPDAGGYCPHDPDAYAPTGELSEMDAFLAEHGEEYAAVRLYELNACW